MHRPVPGLHVHLALLAGAVAVVAANWELSDIAVVRWRETVGDQAFEYPVVLRALYLAERWVTDSLTGIAVTNAVVSAGAAFGVTMLLRWRRADVDVWALSPTLVLVGQNVDGITALLIAVAWLTWAAGKEARAGLAVGAGTALKLTPAILLLPLTLATPRARRLAFVAAAGAVWVVVNVPYALANATAWWFPFEYASLRDDVRGTMWAALPISVETVNRASVTVALVALAVVTVMTRRGTLTPLTGATLAMLAFIATNKVWQPHYLLWVLPLLAFRGVPRRPLRALELANLAFFVAFWLKLDDEASGALYWVTGSARLAAVCWLATVLVTSDRARPGRAGGVPSGVPPA